MSKTAASPQPLTTPEFGPDGESRSPGRVATEAVVDLTVALVGVGLAIGLRLSLLQFKSIDFLNYTKVWYNAIRTGGFWAFSQPFSNYNLPYLYLLYFEARFLPNIPALIATKLPSMIADFICAWIVFEIIRIKRPKPPLALLAALGVLFAPTIVLNSAFWGQADALYSAATLACIYLLLRRKAGSAMMLLGVALAFKAQAMFVVPLVLGLLLRKEIGWKHVVIVPIVMLAALIPALVAGRPLLDLLLIYPAQAGQYVQLSMHAPSAPAWVPNSGEYFPFFYPAALLLGAASGLAMAFVIYRSPAKLTSDLIVALAFLTVVIMPFMLPKMHERYFYLADILAIVFAAYFPSYFYIPVLMISVSFFAYQPTLFGVEAVPIGILSLCVFALLVVIGRHAISLLFPRPVEDQEITAAVE